MLNSLEEFLKRKIQCDGPLDIGQFMALALGHPEHGYYMKGDPFGRGGDFVTSPEVSQMFGEMVGVWAADIWIQMGRPARFILLECGPGRGTLMADLFRGTRHVDGFHAALELHLLEISPVLKGRQAKALAGFSPVWHEDLDSVPEDVPVIVIANEFLDALPFRQFVMTENGWKERVVSYSEHFVFDVQNIDFLEQYIPKTLKSIEIHDIYEFAPARTQFVKEVGSRLDKQNGAALFIDYGYSDGPKVSNTFQGVKGHQYFNVLSNVGDVDLTSHVDFRALVEDLPCQFQEPVSQGQFLKTMGIEKRAEILKQGGAEIDSDLRRLTHPDEMGELFQVLMLYI